MFLGLTAKPRVRDVATQTRQSSLKESLDRSFVAVHDCCNESDIEDEILLDDPTIDPDYQPSTDDDHEDM